MFPSYDNKSTIFIIINLVFHKRIKHVEVDCHFIRKAIINNEMTTQHTRYEDQITYIFTKAFSPSNIYYLCNKLGMFDIFTLNLRGSVELCIYPKLFFTCILVQNPNGILLIEPLHKESGWLNTSTFPHTERRCHAMNVPGIKQDMLIVDWAHTWVIYLAKHVRNYPCIWIGLCHEC